MLKLVLINILFLYSLTSLAGTCCGGGGGSTQLMLGDTKSVIRTKYTDQSVLADKDQDSTYLRNQNEIETIKTFSLSASYRLAQLWQLGFNIPIIEKFKKIDNQWASKAGIGDLNFNIGYEFLPEYRRRKHISQGFVFAQLTLPTAPSLFTSKRRDLLDSRGSGHYKYSTGLIATKRFNSGISILQASLSYRVPGKFKNSLFTEQEITTKESFDNSISFNQSYSFSKSIDGNIGLSRTYTQKKITSTLIGKQTSSLVSPLTLGLIYSASTLSYTFSYSDDFFIAQSYNHILSKSLSLGIIKRVAL